MAEMSMTVAGSHARSRGGSSGSPGGILPDTGEPLGGGVTAGNVAGSGSPDGGGGGAGLVGGPAATPGSSQWSGGRTVPSELLTTGPPTDEDDEDATSVRAAR